MFSSEMFRILLLMQFSMGELLVCQQTNNVLAMMNPIFGSQGYRNVGLNPIDYEYGLVVMKKRFVPDSMPSPPAQSFDWKKFGSEKLAG